MVWWKKEYIGAWFFQLEGAQGRRIKAEVNVKNKEWEVRRRSCRDCVLQKMGLRISLNVSASALVQCSDPTFRIYTVCHSPHKITFCFVFQLRCPYGYICFFSNHSYLFIYIYLFIPFPFGGLCKEFCAHWNSQ